MKKLKVLHVASFKGNIGDNANHVGFRREIQRNIGCEIDFIEFEIREVFWGFKAFNREFVALANQHDFVVIGGGNYFELWVEQSHTGTSFDITIEDLSKINVPIIFNALGIDPAQGASKIAVAKFRHFLDFVIESPNMLLSCRNDGSIKAIREIVGEKYLSHFYHVPDAGLFTEVKDFYHPEVERDKKNIVIQIAGDMLDSRYPKEGDRNLSFEQFLSAFTEYLVKISKLDAHLIFVPHIFRDLNVIQLIINKLPDNIRRKHVSVAPYLVGDKGQDYIFDLYKKSNLVLGMRFHANVCSLGLGVPCIGLVNYRQVDEFYEEMGLSKMKIQVNKFGFECALYKLSEDIITEKVQFEKYDLKVWQNKLNEFHKNVRILLKQQGVF